MAEEETAWKVLHRISPSEASHVAVDSPGTKTADLVTSPLLGSPLNTAAWGTEPPVPESLGEYFVFKPQQQEL